MFLRVVILVFAATCCTARVIDVSDKQSAWERSGKFEGDIMLTDEQKRNGLINTESRWAFRTVPFLIDDVFTDDERNQILLAFDDYHNQTSIRFLERNRSTERHYIHITGEDTGCWSYVGRIGGRQQLNLQRGVNSCVEHGIIIHELLHALGFYHQHRATERDDYVTINWENIEPGMEENFEKFNASYITSFGVPYDYDSIMHYGPYAYSKNGLQTIEPKDPNAQIGQRDGLSEKDIEKLEKMYKNVCERQSVWEWSSRLEDDIVLTDGQKRNAWLFPTNRWPNKVVPFLIDDVFTDDERNKILVAILEYFLKTSIRFKIYDPLIDIDYIHITENDFPGCMTFVGRLGGRQQVRLQRGEFGCVEHGIIIHELLHVLGFFHQHMASDRDNYVTINWQNIRPANLHEFRAHPEHFTTNFGVPYDYDSILHYGPCSFTRNGLPTIEPKDPNARIGQRDGLSAKDILKLERIYDDSFFPTEENSSNATRSQFITLIIGTLLVLTHLQ